MPGAKSGLSPPFFLPLPYPVVQWPPHWTAPRLHFQGHFCWLHLQVNIHCADPVHAAFLPKTLQCFCVACGLPSPAFEPLQDQERPSLSRCILCAHQLASDGVLAPCFFKVTEFPHKWHFFGTKRLIVVSSLIVVSQYQGSAQSNDINFLCHLLFQCTAWYHHHWSIFVFREGA